MKKPEMLYHYTAIEYLPKIIASGRILRTSSNLLKPKCLQVVQNPQTGYLGIADPATDWFKPVVWMTDSESPEGLGVPDVKQSLRLSIPMQRHYQKWNKWAKKNNMAPHLARGLTYGMNWQSWYISEYEIPLEDVSEILDTATNTVIDWRCLLAG